MNYNITLPERMLLECLLTGDQTLPSIKVQCQLEQTAASNILQSLVSKNLVVIKNKKYTLNNELSSSMRQELHSSSDLLIEVSEILNSCVRETISKSDAKPFKMKKVSMTAREQKIYKGLLYNMESFLTSVSNDDKNIANQTIIFWGEQNYGKVINDCLNY